MVENSSQKRENWKRLFKASTILHLVPVWLGNLLLFGFIITIVCVYFIWQIRVAQKTFLHYVREHKQMISEVIKKNADNTLSYQDGIEKIVEALLKNTVLSIDALETVQPFSETKLDEFVKEAGLTGVRIIRNSGERVDAPAGWFPDKNIQCDASFRCIPQNKEKGLYLLISPMKNTLGCIAAGISSERVESVLQKKMGSSSVLDTLSGVEGIEYAKLEKNSAGGDDKPDPEEWKFKDNFKIAEVRLNLGKDTLIMGLDTKHFFIRVEQLRSELIVLSIVIALISAVFSWIIYLYQSLHLEEMRTIERKLAKEHEDAALGRATGVITHEIRNPLNAIHMGLQRLQIESSELTPEHRDLISTILGAISRINEIITNLKRYSTSLQPDKAPVEMASIVRNILTLYKQQCVLHSVSVDFVKEEGAVVKGDSGLLAEVVENLVKNGIEAQPGGGYLKIRLLKKEKEVVLSIENSGYHLSEGDIEQIFEPYFTTKTRGSGVGLAIARRIVMAHNGRIEAEVPSEGTLRITVYLPVENEAREGR